MEGFVRLLTEHIKKHGSIPTLEQIQWEFEKWAIEYHNGNLTQAAQTIGCSVRGLSYRVMSSIDKKSVVLEARIQKTAQGALPIPF